MFKDVHSKILGQREECVSQEGTANTTSGRSTLHTAGRHPSICVSINNLGASSKHTGYQKWVFVSKNSVLFSMINAKKWASIGENKDVQLENRLLKQFKHFPPLWEQGMRIWRSGACTPRVGPELRASWWGWGSSLSMLGTSYLACGGFGQSNWRARSWNFLELPEQVTRTIVSLLC